jgi:hypothetical protein
MKPVGILVCGALLSGLLPGSLQAENPESLTPRQFMVQLIHAQNVRIEDDPSIEPELRKKLVTLFGYDRYRKIGQAVSSVHDDQPSRLSASEMFDMRMVMLKKKRNTYQFELIQQGNSVFKGKVTPKPKVPIIIRGPFYDKGNLILVIHETQAAK